MKNYIKKNILPSLVKLNLEQLYHFSARGRILNVFYHGVVNNDSTRIFPRHIVKEQFEQHMKYLSSKFNVISIEEAFYLRRKGIRPDKKTITVSFDDGYLNNLQTALPIIEKYKVKTTFFVSGICSEDESYVMWSDLVSFARHFSNREHVVVGDQVFVKTGRYELINREKNLSLYQYIKELSYAERDVVLKEIRERYELDQHLKSLPAELRKLMNRDQIRELSQSDMVTIGSHGHLHYNLGNISVQEAEHEMRISKEILSAITGKNIDLISFPDGSYTEDVKKSALSLGYKGLLAVDFRCPSDLQDLNILNRWGVSGTTTFETVAFSLNKAFIRHSF